MSERKGPQVIVGGVTEEHELDGQIGEGDDEPMDATLSNKNDRYNVLLLEPCPSGVVF
jgi:hypothetical protein